MKNIKILILSLLAVIAVSCNGNDDGTMAYSGGQNDLAFSFGESQNIVILPDAGTFTDKVYFGTYRNVSQDHSVKLVFDAENSTAVEGVDFDIVESTKTLQSGTALNFFEVIVYEAPANTLGKLAVFKLECATLDLSTVKIQRNVMISLGCPLDLSTFPLKYTVDVFASSSQVPQHIVDLTVVGGAVNTFSFENLWSARFVSTLTGDNSYVNQFGYKGKLIINCDDTVTVVSDNDYSTGGTGIYDPFSGMIDVTVDQEIFNSPFTVNCIMFPVME